MLRTDVNMYDTFCLENSLTYLGEEEVKADKSVNGTPVSDEVIENSKRKGVIGKIGGIGADSNEPTRNGRRYPLELWQNVEKSEYFIEGMANRSLIGEADHPAERVDYSVTEGAVVLTKYEIQDNGQVYTEFDILDTIPGRTVKTYFDAGCKLGVSSRGLGEELVRNGETIIDPETYQFYCFDVVAFPAVKTARMELLESTSPKKQAMINSITSEIKKCKSTDEVRFIESMSQGVNLYLDEIKEAVENKLEELSEDKDNTKELAKSIIDKIEKKDNKSTEDSQLSDFLKAWLGESNKSITDLAKSLNEEFDASEHNDKFKYMLLDRCKNDCLYFLGNGNGYEGNLWGKSIEEHIKVMRELYDSVPEKPEWLTEEDINSFEAEMILKRDNTNTMTESMTDGYIGKNWNEVIDKLKAAGYEIDSAYLDAPQNEETILLYKDNKKFKASVNKYSDGGYEILTSTIKEENNKIKISGPKFNKSDEDTPEVLDRDSDENLEILAEIQECINVKNSKIDELDTQIKNKTEAIKNLVAKVHSSNVALQEANNEKSSLSKKYENLHRVNEEFSSIMESIKATNNSIISENKSLKEKLVRCESELKTANDTNLKLQESLNSSTITQNKVTSLTENVNTLKSSNGVLIAENKKLESNVKKQEETIKSLTEQNADLENKCTYSLEKYIEAVCLKYNLQKDVLKRMLGENYTFADVDKVADKMLEKISKMNALPFKDLIPSRQIVYENVGLVNEIEHDSSEELDTFDFMVNSGKN